MPARTSHDLDQYELPEPMAERSRIVLEAGERPATVGEFAAALSAFFEDAGLSVGPEDLCTTAESRHRARIDGETRHYRCVLDALLVPFVHPDAESVAVRSLGPLTETPVEATVSTPTDDATGTASVDVEPERAVVSLGIDADAPPASELEVSPLEAYDLFCPYVNAFPDREAYEAWDEETPEAVTTAVPFDAALAVAERLAAAPAGPSD